MGYFASCVCCCCSICISACAKNVPLLLLQLLTLENFYCTRARLTLEPSRLLCVLPLAFYLHPKANRRCRQKLSSPRLWIKSGNVLRCAGDALRTLGPRRACRLPPAARRTAELWETRARRSRPDRPAPRAHRARPGTSRDVQSARLPARRTARSRRAERRALGAQNETLSTRRTARSRRAERRASGALSDASYGALNGALPARRTARSRCADGTSLWRAKFLTSELVLFESGLVAVFTSRLGNVYAQPHSL